MGKHSTGTQKKDAAPGSKVVLIIKREGNEDVIALRDSTSEKIRFYKELYHLTYPECVRMLIDDGLRARGKGSI